MKYVYKLEVWQDGDAPRQVVMSKQYKSLDKARNGMLKAMKATDLLNDLELINLGVTGWIEGVGE